MICIKKVKMGVASVSITLYVDKTKGLKDIPQNALRIYWWPKETSCDEEEVTCMKKIFKLNNLYHFFC